LLDLSFNESDLEEVEKEGSANMENAYAYDAIESLSLFGEMVGFSPRSKAFKMSHCKIISDLTKKDRGEIVFGPIVITARHIIYLQIPFPFAQFIPSQSPRVQAF